MKGIFLLFSVIGLCFGALEVPDHLKKSAALLRKGCLDKTGAKAEDVEASKNGNLVDTPEMRCYVLCFFEHVGMINEDATVDFEKVFHLLPQSVKETADKVIQACGTKHGETRCDTAWLTVRRFFDIAPEGAELP